MSNTPNEAEISIHNLFHSYRVGWGDGAAMRAMKTTFLQHQNEQIKTEYEKGYKEGRESRRLSLNEAASRLGYTPKVLRLQEAAS